MGSLREVKNRINSIKSTRKITSAMRLVASSKLARVEDVLENIYDLKSIGRSEDTVTVENAEIVELKEEAISLYDEDIWQSN